jgi:hypothetical protein
VQAKLSTAPCSSQAGTRPTRKTLCIFEIPPAKFFFNIEKGVSGGSVLLDIAKQGRK